MGLLTLGMSHKTASVELREQVAFQPERMYDALVNARQQAGLQEVAILSTCNRTEIYCATEPDHLARLIKWLAEYHHLKLGHIRQAAYEFWDRNAVRHLMRVASGLDSLVLGEPQILGQLKEAYAVAREAKTLGPELNRLFECSFSVAKQIRSETTIGVNPVSVASAAVSLAKHIFADLRKSRVLLIGAGETVELVARHLQQQNVREIIVANRTQERAKALASHFDGLAIGLEELPQALERVDIVVSSTASPVPVLGKGTVERAHKKRKHRPMFMIDIAVPRDIEAEVGELGDVYLYTVDDLQATVEENRRSREQVAAQAEKIVELRCEEFMAQLRELDGVETIKQYRQVMEALRQEELTKALRQLQNGGDPEAVLQRMSRSFANKIMHQPSMEIKKASAEGRLDLLEWSHELFGLHPVDQAVPDQTASHTQSDKDSE